MILRSIANAIIRLAAWEAVGDIAPRGKAVLIAAPHTSNWDGVWLLVYKVAKGLNANFLAKDTLFWWPLGSILYALGAIPIDRKHSANVISKLVKQFKERDHFYLALAPEGTRKRRPYWKSGFYRIALEAGVPIVMGFIDYKNKRMGIGESFMPSGNVELDMAHIRDFYARCSGRHPENATPAEFAPGTRVSPPADQAPAVASSGD